MKHYLTIRQFARLRAADVNSLLYYQKLGLLCPAYIDPNTGYRYYEPAQLGTLDWIQVAVRLGIPLKTLHRYLEPDGTVRYGAFMADARALAEQKINALQQDLEMIGKLQQTLQENAACGPEGKAYRRTIHARTLVCSAAMPAARFVPKDMMQASEQLYEHMNSRAMRPMLPGGVMLLWQGEGKAAQLRLYLEAATPGPAPTAPPQGRVLQLPQAEYDCVRLNVQSTTAPAQLVYRQLDVQPGQLFIISNYMMRELEQGGSLTVEIQRCPQGFTF